MDKNIHELVTGILDGSATIADQNAFKEWMKANEENRREFEEIEGFWNALEILMNKVHFDSSKGYREFLKFMEQEESEESQKNPLRYFWHVAASLLIILGFSYLIWLVSQPVKQQIAFFELNTPNGSHTLLTLTDGTTVWLNAGSKLKYPDKFDKESRVVYLEGEAYFHVKKNPEQPFIVETSEVKVKAFGTTFNVKAYPNEGSIETTLIEGSVVVEGKTSSEAFKPIKLEPNQRVTVVKATGKLLLNDQEKKLLETAKASKDTTSREKENVLVSEKVNTQLYTSWVDNQLLFDNETFESIAFKLERRYGASISFVDEKVKKYRFSGKFPDISIDRVLNAMNFASPFEYTIKQDSIFIK